MTNFLKTFVLIKSHVPPKAHRVSPCLVYDGGSWMHIERNKFNMCELNFKRRHIHHVQFRKRAPKTHKCVSKL